MSRRALVLAAGLCAAALATSAVPAVAQTSPFSPVPAPAPQPAPVPAPAPAPSSNPRGGLGSGATVALAIAAGILLAGIAFVIVRDARRSAPQPARRPSPPRPPTPAAPGARGRPTGKGGARRRARGR